MPSVSCGCKRGDPSEMNVLLAPDRRIKVHQSLFLLIADENERLALPCSSHPCSSVLPSFLKEGKPCRTTPTALPYLLAPQLHPLALTWAVKQKQWQGLTPNPAAIGSS